MARALMEGISYRLAMIYDGLRESRIARSDAVLVGSGGALLASPSWCQIIADVTGAPLHVSDSPEATSRGAAVLVASGVRPSSHVTTSLSDDLVTFRPDVHRHKIYRAAMARQQELYAKLVRFDR
jgi:sugar (pentulose or hexulose) kinase